MKLASEARKISKLYSQKMRNTQKLLSKRKYVKRKMRKIWQISKCASKEKSTIS
jgi:ribosomal protein L37AE/L43A